MFEELQKRAYQRHPYGRPIIGYAEDLDKMTISDCEDFYRSHYAPNNAVICVVGAIKPLAAAKVIQKHYGRIPAFKTKGFDVPVEPSQQEERVSLLNLPLQVEKTYMGYRVPEAKHLDHAALAVACAVLSTGRSSRLYLELVDKGITLDASISSGGSKDPALAYASFTSQNGRRAEEAIDAFDHVMESFLREGPRPEELERAKNKLRTEIHMGLSTNSSLSHFIGQNVIVMGGIRPAVEELERIAAVTQNEVLVAARRYFLKKNRTVVIGKPR
jgi:predicted Zn-dependent peptidase